MVDFTLNTMFLITDYRLGEREKSSKVSHYHRIVEIDKRVQSYYVP